jgi:hypothetical protein
MKKRTMAKTTLLIAAVVCVIALCKSIDTPKAQTNPEANNSIEPTFTNLNATKDTETETIVDGSTMFAEEIVEPQETPSPAETEPVTSTDAPTQKPQNNNNASSNHNNDKITVKPTKEPETIVDMEVTGSTEDPEIEIPEETVTETPDTESEHVHNYVAAETVKPNCTTGGYTVYVCSCGDAYNGDETNAIAHNYRNGVCDGCGEKDPVAETEPPSTEDDSEEQDDPQPTDPGVNTGHVCGANDQHAEVKVGGYTYVYCSSIEKPYKGADGFTIYYPYSFYF